jgi:chorismate mutase
MQSLRAQVDRIDLKMLQFLQKRTKLASEIGRMKRRHGAVVYVPERERELVARVIELSKGQPSARAVAALYREIFSISRSAQGQAPIGLLQATAPMILPAARAGFGACDQFLPRKTWAGLEKGLGTGALSLALVTGDDLTAAFQAQPGRGKFFHRFTVTGDILSGEVDVPLARKIFIVTPRRPGPALQVDRVLILIECKSAVNAIKSLLHAMPDFPFQSEHLTRRAGIGRGVRDVTLAHLSLSRPVDAFHVTTQLEAAGKSTGLSMSILGIYPGPLDYGGR